MEFENIIINIENRIATITLNREKQLNALNKKTIQELHKALSFADQSKDVRVIIITGKGEKAFVAGADIKEFASYGSEEAYELSNSGQTLLFDFIEQLSTPVIAAVNGFALGGGLELSLSCHIRICSQNAKMGLPEVSLGLIPGYGGTQRLAHQVGRGKANEMIMTGEMISAENALSWGLVNHVVEQEELIESAKKIASKIIKNSPNAIAAAIRSVNANYDQQSNGFETEKKEFAGTFDHAESKEGITAFMEKRPAKF